MSNMNIPVARVELSNKRANKVILEAIDDRIIGEDIADPDDVSLIDLPAGLVGLELDLKGGDDKLIAKNDISGALLSVKADLGDGNDLLDWRKVKLLAIEANGGAGEDRLLGGGANDKLSGDDGNDVIRGRGGDDVIHGGDGDDRLFGGRGADVISGNAGDDVIRGGRNDDELFGNRGNDQLFGNGGADKLNGGRGDDQLTGGFGADVFVFANPRAGFGDDTITDFQRFRDKIDLSAFGLSGIRDDDLNIDRDFLAGNTEITITGFSGSITLEDFTRRLRPNNFIFEEM